MKAVLNAAGTNIMSYHCRHAHCEGRPQCCRDSQAQLPRDGGGRGSSQVVLMKASIYF